MDFNGATVLASYLDVECTIDVILNHKAVLVCANSIRIMVIAL